MCITLGTLGAGKGRRKKIYFAMRNSEQWSLGYLLCRTHFSIQSQICPKGRISFNGYGSSMGRGVRGSTLDMMLRIAAHLVAWRLSQDHESLRPSTNHHWLSRMIIDHHGSLLIVTNHHSLQLITSRTVVMTVLGMRTQPCEGKGTTGPEESLSGSKIMVPWGPVPWWTPKMFIPRDYVWPIHMCHGLVSPNGAKTLVWKHQTKASPWATGSTVNKMI